MDYTVKNVEVRKFKRRNKLTSVVDIVSVSNRNNLSVEEHLRLLNLNDKEHEYSVIPMDEKNAPTEAGAEDNTVDVTIPNI